MKNLVIFPLKLSQDFNGFWFYSGSSYYSFQWNWVWDDALIIQNIFAFVCATTGADVGMVDGVVSTLVPEVFLDFSLLLIIKKNLWDQGW